MLIRHISNRCLLPSSTFPWHQRQEELPVSSKQIQGECLQRFTHTISLIAQNYKRSASLFIASHSRVKGFTVQCHIVPFMLQRKQGQKYDFIKSKIATWKQAKEVYCSFLHANQSRASNSKNLQLTYSDHGMRFKGKLGKNNHFRNLFPKLDSFIW